MSFFKKLFGGDDDQQAVHKRIWPANIDADSASPEAILAQGVVYTRVFLLKNKEDSKRSRSKDYAYISATKQTDASWRVRQHSYDSRDMLADVSTPRIGSFGYTDNDLEIVTALASFERRMITNGNEPVFGSTRNYELLANRHNRHVDAEGNLVFINGAAPLTTALTMGNSSKQSFYKASATLPPLSTWEGFYARVVDPMFSLDAEKLEEIRADRNYYHLTRAASEVLDCYAKLPQALAGLSYKPLEKALNQRDFGEMYFRGASMEHWSRMQAACCVIALLRAGAVIIETVPDTAKGGLNTAKLTMLAELRRQTLGVLQSHLGIEATEARRVCDIMLKGPDPRAGEPSPMEKFFAQFPPPPRSGSGYNL